MENKELILTENFTVQYSQMNCNLALKPYNLFNFLQDIASNSAQNLGFGYSFVSSNNLAWFLLKYRMEFDEYPINVYDLTIKTEPRGYNKLFAYRSFEILENERRLGCVFSAWTLINLETRTPVLVQNVVDNPCMTPYQKREDDLAFSKIRPLSKIDKQKEFFVRYNDLDVNGHANNGNYIIWAFETLSMDFINSHKIRTLDVMFKKEARYDETVISELEFKNGNITLHRIRNKDNEDLCLFECEWV